MTKNIDKALIEILDGIKPQAREYPRPGHRSQIEWKRVTFTVPAKLLKEFETLLEPSVKGGAKRRAWHIERAMRLYLELERKRKNGDKP